MLRALAHGVLVHLAAGEDHVADGVDLLGLLHIVSAVLLEGLDHVVIHGGGGDGGLLAGADDAVVKRSALEDLRHCDGDIHAAVNDALHVADADAVGGLAAGIGGSDHGHAAGGDDHVDLLHQLGGRFDGRRIDN